MMVSVEYIAIEDLPSDGISPLSAPSRPTLYNWMSGGGQKAWIHDGRV